MAQTSDFSTQQITPQLISQIIDAIKNKAYGSVEIYIENYQVTQISERTITKLKKTENKPSEIQRGQNINRFQLKIQKF